MKTKTAKQAKQAKPNVQLKDMKPKREGRGGGNTIYVGSANGGVWKTRNGG